MPRYRDVDVEAPRATKMRAVSTAVPCAKTSPSVIGAWLEMVPAMQAEAQAER